MLSVVSFFLALLAFNCLLCVKAGLFVVDPQQGSVCHGDEPCTVTWLDDGESPLLSAIGVVNVGLYTGNQQLVQAIEPVDVSQEHSLTFTPDPAAGPNSDAYYISFISTSAKQNNSLPYAAFSTFFRLDQMTGSFATPDPDATNSIPIPPSILSAKPTNSDGGIITTITVGTLSTSPTPEPTFTSPGSSPIATGSSPTTASHTSLLSGPAAPSGFSTSSSVSLPSGVSGSSSSSASTSGAVGAGISRRAGTSIALTSVVGLFLVL